MDFELHKDEHSFKIRMEIYENISNIEEIIRNFYQNDILHLFLNPIYVKIQIK